VACKTGAIAAARRQSNLPIWVSYTLRDEAGREGPTELRSGESVEQAVALGIRRAPRQFSSTAASPK